MSFSCFETIPGGKVFKNTVNLMIFVKLSTKLYVVSSIELFDTSIFKQLSSRGW